MSKEHWNFVIEIPKNHKNFNLTYKEILIDMMKDKEQVETLKLFKIDVVLNIIKEGDDKGITVVKSQKCKLGL